MARYSLPLPVFLPLALLAMVSPSSFALAEPTPHEVLVWPGSARVDAADLELATSGVRDSGHHVVPFGPTRARLEKALEELEASRRRVNAAVEAGLASAREAYLEQRFTSAIETLEGIEKQVIESQPVSALQGALWPIEILLGIVHQARAVGGDDDLERTRRFELALALAPRRLPPEDFFGPRISRSFTSVRDSWQLRPTSAVPVEVTPLGARISIDGGPWQPASAPVSLRAGLHVLVASAPGSGRVARLVDTTSNATFSATLPPGNVDDAGVALDWREGRLSMSEPAALALLRRVMLERGADSAIVIESPGQIMLVTGDTVIRQTGAPPTIRAAVEQLLAELAPEMIGPPISPLPPARDAPVYRRWWFWAGVAALAATGGVALTLALSDRSERLEIHAPTSAMLRF